MRHIFKIIPALCIFALVLFACKNDAPQAAAATPVQSPSTTSKAKKVSAEGARSFTVSEATVFWAGKKAIGDFHTGSIQSSEGTLKVNEGTLLSGNIVLDMSSITVTDIKDPGEKRDLESHLKDSDFFEVGKFPKAEFKIAEVLPSNNPAFNYVINGTLTMKGKTHPVNIPVKMKIEDKALTAESATFTINRTQWGVNFRSGLLGTAKDKLIEDVVTLSLKLRAVAK
ncbi:MAG: YceI family protein [Bacteroidota bacterium]